MKTKVLRLVRSLAACGAFAAASAGSVAAQSTATACDGAITVFIGSRSIVVRNASGRIVTVVLVLRSGGEATITLAPSEQTENLGALATFITDIRCR